MSHAIYQTKAVILSSKNMRESNKLLVFLTEKFGLIYVTSQSLRELKSKMRFHTNKYSLVTIDVVQGRNIWRLTGIHELQSSLSFVDSNWYVLIDKISSLIMRLCSSEEPYPELWNDVENIFNTIQDNKNTSQKIVSSIEIIYVIRLLHHLGYWDGTELFLSDDDFTQQQYYDEIQNNKKKYISKINSALVDSQL